MTSAELYQWMADPSLLSRSSLVELKQMVEDYPCFHAVRMLYLKNLAVLEDVRLEKELKKMSVYVPDRRQLFMLINDRCFAVDKTTEPKTPVIPGNVPDKTEEIFDMIDRVFGEPEPNTIEPVLKTTPQPVPPAAAASDYVHWLAEYADDLPAEEGKENRMKHQDLIDSFIASEGSQLTRRLKEPEAPEAPEADKPYADSDPVAGLEVVDGEGNKDHSLEPENLSLDDSFFTETLARVYVKQKRYDKALEIIRVLSLKYPEKSIYFADQIRYLEKIIHLKK